MLSLCNQRNPVANLARFADNVTSFAPSKNEEGQEDIRLLPSAQKYSDIGRSVDQYHLIKLKDEVNDESKIEDGQEDIRLLLSAQKYFGFGRSVDQYHLIKMKDEVNDEYRFRAMAIVAVETIQGPDCPKEEKNLAYLTLRECAENGNSYARQRLGFLYTWQFFVMPQEFYHHRSNGGIQLTEDQLSPLRNALINISKKLLDKGDDEKIDEAAELVGKCLADVFSDCDLVDGIGFRIPPSFRDAREELHIPANLQSFSPAIDNKAWTGMITLVEKQASLSKLDFHGENAIGNDGIRMLAMALRKNLVVKSLELYSNNIDEVGVKDFCDVLRDTNPSLTSLSLHRNPVGDKGTEIMMAYLHDNITISHLDWYCTNIGDEGAVAVSRLLKKNTSLISLDLGNNRITDVGARALSEALQANKSLTTLILHDNDIGDDGMIAVLEALKNNSTLTKLELYDNNFGNSTARCIVGLLATNTTLRSIAVWGNKMDAEGINTLIPFNGRVELEDKLALVRLPQEPFGHPIEVGEGIIEDIRTNKVSNILSLNWVKEFGERLCAALKVNTTITALNLKNLGDEGAGLLAGVLGANLFIKELYMIENHIGPEGAKALAEALQKNTTLQLLDLSRNKLQPHGAGYFADMLKINKTLKYLSLSDNSIGEEGGVKLCQALTINTSLTLLVISYNNIQSGAEVIAGLLPQMSLRVLVLHLNKITESDMQKLLEAANNKKGFLMGLRERTQDGCGDPVVVEFPFEQSRIGELIRRIFV